MVTINGGKCSKESKRFQNKKKKSLKNFIVRDQFKPTLRYNIYIHRISQLIVGLVLIFKCFEIVLKLYENIFFI